MQLLTSCKMSAQLWSPYQVIPGGFGCKSLSAADPVAGFLGTPRGRSLGLQEILLFKGIVFDPVRMPTDDVG